MCNTTARKFKSFFIEVFENGKVSLPAFVPLPDQQLTIDELKRCRDYIDLIIANPDNFHVVKPVDDNNGTSFKFPKFDTCKGCGCDLRPLSVGEHEKTICFNCEKKLMEGISQVNPPFDQKSFEDRIGEMKEDAAIDNEIQSLAAEMRKHVDEDKFMAKATEVTVPFVDAMNSVEIGKPKDQVYAPPPSVATKEFVCSDCGKGFNIERQLQRHKITFCPKRLS